MAKIGINVKNRYGQNNEIVDLYITVDDVDTVFKRINLNDVRWGNEDQEPQTAEEWVWDDYMLEQIAIFLLKDASSYAGPGASTDAIKNAARSMDIDTGL